MRYVEKYDRYVDDDLVVYRYTKSGKFVQCKPCISKTGYWVLTTKLGTTKFTKEHFSSIRKGKKAPNKGKPVSEFGEKFKIYCEQNNVILNYSTEYNWYRTHNHRCRWEEL